MRDRFDTVALIAGLFFLGVAVIWGFGGMTLRPSAGWALPALLIVAGLVGLVVAILGGRRGSTDDR